MPVSYTHLSQIAEQESRHEKTRAVTKGKFSSAGIEHGKAPKNGTYEYMVLIQPSAADFDDLRKTPAYEVLQRDQTAHVVYDKKTGITAYAVFEAYQPVTDKVIACLLYTSCMGESRIGQFDNERNYLPLGACLSYQSAGFGQ